MLFYGVNLMIIPLSIMFFGWWFTKEHPKKINSFFGYRSKMSMKNLNTWRAAHEYFGRLWFRIGLNISIVTIMILYLFRNSSNETLDKMFAVLLVIDVVVLLLPIIATEIMLRKKFDSSGEYKD